VSAAQGAAGPYEPNWESLRQYRVPTWFRDAKLGIFIHWGVYAVPAYGNEWYPRRMYLPDDPTFAHHRDHYGPQDIFGYKDFIPSFRAERWDPTAWVSLFHEAGAKYIVPVAEHHDGFPMYATGYTPWNAAAMGPRRDVIAELAHVVRAAGLKFGVSSHRAFNWRYYPKAGDFDTVRPEHAALYSPVHGPDEPATPEWLADWYARTCELVDKFSPDLLWFDFGWHQAEFHPYHPQVAATYYNHAAANGYEPVLNYKDCFPDGVAVYDIERGKLADIRPHTWQTDTSVSVQSWGYVEHDTFKSVTTLVHDLVDIVSKNGNLLLNVGPRADGTIPDAAADRLRGLGRWLTRNGEAIYGTRHWGTFGEGPTAVEVGHLSEQNNQPFGARDIRYTCRPGKLYAILMGWPTDGRVRLGALATTSTWLDGEFSAVRMLGAPGELPWRQDPLGLTVDLPPSPPGEHAWALELSYR